MNFINWLFSCKETKNPRTEIVRDDLIGLAVANYFDVIIHGCNCFHAMHSGIAKTISRKWPEVEKADRLTLCGDKTKLGNYSHTTVSGKEGYSPYEVMIINAYTQYEPGANVDYSAIRNVMQKLHKDLPMNVTIGLPRIGSGIAGGNWQIIEDIILTELPNRFLTIVAFIP